MLSENSEPEPKPRLALISSSLAWAYRTHYIYKKYTTSVAINDKA
jgi:hypothetical protein